MTRDELILLKYQLRIEPEFTGQDLLLRQCWDSAVAYVVKTTARSIEELSNPITGEWMADIRQALLLLAAHYYNAPSATDAKAPSAVPYSLDAILKPHIRLV